MNKRPFVAGLSLAIATSLAPLPQAQAQQREPAPEPAAPVTLQVTTQTDAHAEEDDAPPPASAIVSREEVSALRDVPSRSGAPKAPPSPYRPVITAGGGYVFGSMHHPDLNGTRFVGPMLNLGVGVAIARQWVVAIELSNFETNVTRNGAGKFESGTSGASFATIHPMAESLHSGSTTGGMGGYVKSEPIHIQTIGPRVDFAPLGATGPFIGLTAGASVVQDVAFRVGGAGAARAGFRWQPVGALALSLEAGAHGHVFREGSAALPYAALQATLFLSKNDIR